MATKTILEVNQSNKLVQKTQPPCRVSLDSKKKKTTVFKVVPDIQNDIYHLYSSDGTFVDIAYIQTYEKSVMMNKLFRNIKENDRLDALEEISNLDNLDFILSWYDSNSFFNNSFSIALQYWIIKGE